MKLPFNLKIFEWKSSRTILENFEYSLQEANQSSFSNNKVNGVKKKKKQQQQVFPLQLSFLLFITINEKKKKNEM